MPLEVYFAGSEPHPMVDFDRIEDGQAYVYTNYNGRSLEVILVHSSADGSGGEVYAHELGAITSLAPDIDEVLKSEHFAGRVSSDTEYRQQITTRDGATRVMRVVYIGKTALNY